MHENRPAARVPLFLVVTAAVMVLVGVVVLAVSAPWKSADRA